MRTLLLASCSKSNDSSESLLFGHDTTPAERQDQSATGQNHPSLRPKRILHPWRSRFGRSDGYFWDTALATGIGFLAVACGSPAGQNFYSTPSGSAASPGIAQGGSGNAAGASQGGAMAQGGASQGGAAQ